MRIGSEVALNLAKELEALSAKISTQCRPFGSFEQITSMNEASMEKVMQIVRHQRKLLEERSSDIFDVDADRRDLRSALINLRLRTNEDIFGRIENGDIIEIYDANFVQFFHNWVFHYYCSYDLVTLITEPIWTLYSRPQEIAQMLVARAKEVMANDSGIVESWNIPTHYLKETKLRTPRLFKIDLKYISVVRDLEGRPVGVISTNQCTPTELTTV